MRFGKKATSWKARPLTPAQERWVLTHANTKPRREIAVLVSRSESFIQKLIRDRLGPQRSGRRWYPEAERPHLPIYDEPGVGAPVCHRCRGSLSFDTDWLGRVLEWCPRGCSSPSTCNPRRAA